MKRLDTKWHTMMSNEHVPTTSAFIREYGSQSTNRHLFSFFRGYHEFEWFKPSRRGFFGTITHFGAFLIEEIPDHCSYVHDFVTAMTIG